MTIKEWFMPTGKLFSKNKRKLSPSIQTFGGTSEGFSIQGASHLKHNKICQDYGGHYRCDDYAIAVVCDGHGSDACFRSDRGSRFGVQIAIDSIKEFMNGKKAFVEKLSGIENETLRKKCSDSAIEQIIRNIIFQWGEAVAADMKENPFTEDELKDLTNKYRQSYSGDNDNDKFPAYGSTLIAVVYAPEFWFGLRIGDGKCVSVSRDASLQDPIPWDEKCFLNMTTSLCDEKAFANFRYCFFTDNFPVAIYVGTDGVDDSFGTDERLFSFYRLLTGTFAIKGFDGGKQELREYLPKLTEEGSGDDISISGIIDMDAIKELFPPDVKEKETDVE